MRGLCNCYFASGDMLHNHVHSSLELLAEIAEVLLRTLSRHTVVELIVQWIGSGFSGKSDV